MTHPSLCALREGTRRLLSTLLVCVGAVALIQAAAWPSPDAADHASAAVFTFAPSAGQLALTPGTVAEDPPDNDDDGDDDVIGSAAVLPDRPSAGDATRAQFFTQPDLRFARPQISRCRALRAPPGTAL